MPALQSYQVVKTWDELQIVLSRNSQRLLKARCGFLASCPVTTQSRFVSTL